VSYFMMQPSMHKLYIFTGPIVCGGRDATWMEQSSAMLSVP
jgi:hypothetical protein